MDKNFLKIIEENESKILNQELLSLLNKLEKDFDSKYNDEDIKKLKRSLDVIDKVLNNFDLLTEEQLREYFKNFKNKDELKANLEEQKFLIEDFFASQETEKKLVKENSYNLIKKAINESNEKIEYKKKSLKLFWINIAICLLSFFTTSLLYAIDIFTLKIGYSIVLFFTNTYFIFKYVKIKFLMHKKIKNKFDHWQPITYMIFALFIEIVCLLYLFNIKIADKQLMFYISLVLNVPLISLAIGSFCTSFKLTESNFGALALSLSLGLLMFILEESFGAYMPIPNWAIDLLLIITFFIWISSIVKNCMIITSITPKTITDFIALFFEVVLTITLGFYAIYRIFYYDTTLFSNISSLYAALCGGLLTLGGVAWTIKNQETNRKKENLLKNKPYLYLTKQKKDVRDFNIAFCNQQNIKLVNNDEICDITKEKEKGKDFYIINSIYIENSNNSNILIKGIKVNNNFFKIDGMNYIQKQEIFCINKIQYLYLDYITMELIVSDIENNEYTYQIFLNKKYKEVDIKFKQKKKKIPMYIISAKSLEIKE